MTFSAVPALIDAIVAAAADALTDVYVSDGYAASSTKADVLMIGVDDPDIDGAQFTAETEKDFATTGLDGSHHETGEIMCLAMAAVGDRNGQKTVRDRVYAIADAVDSLCRIRGGSDPAFGVPYVLWTRCGSRTQLQQIPGDRGRGAMLLFRIYFEARP